MVISPGRKDGSLPLIAMEGEWCFFEDVDPAPWLSKAEKVVLYRWNRIYPAVLPEETVLALAAVVEEHPAPVVDAGCKDHDRPISPTQNR